MGTFAWAGWRGRGGAASLVIALSALLGSCGGGGGNAGACISGSAATCGNNTFAGSNAPAITLPARVPLSGPEAYAGVCTAEGMADFTRAWMDEVYLWYREMPSADPRRYGSLEGYFYALLTPQLDTAGQPKDRFSFITSAAAADSLLTGSGMGYGVLWEADAQGRTRAAHVEPGSPAAAEGITRGAELVGVISPAGASWYPTGAESIRIRWRPAPGAAAREATLQAAPVVEDPLPLQSVLTTASGRKVGYLLFNAHTEGAQDRLIPAVRQLQALAVQDLVLDLRYNGGGYLYAALSLASMLVGPAVDGAVFEQLRFNDKRDEESDAATFRFAPTPVVAEPAHPLETPLPRLALPRVHVIATEGTCSASESIVNGLRGIGIEVVLVGGTTCGKPFGFLRQDNCGIAYFPIEFQGTNAQGFGDYAQGFTPTCPASDDFDRPLGDPAERMLATALHHVETGRCPADAPMSAAASPRSSPLAPTTRLRGRMMPPSPSVPAPAR